MNKIILFICILFCKPCYSQNFREAVPQNYQFLDGEKKSIQVGKDPGYIDGTPSLQDQWAFGILMLENGKVFSDSSIIYSLYSNRLFIKKDGNVYPIDYPVKEFILESSNNSGEKKIYHFEKNFPSIDQNDYSTFYEILFNGLSIKFLKKENKLVRTSHPYNEPEEREYSTVTKFFIFFPKENKIVALGRNITLKDLKKNLPQYSHLIDSYNSYHKLDLKKISDLQQLFSFLESSRLELASSNF